MLRLSLARLGGGSGRGVVRGACCRGRLRRRCRPACPPGPKVNLVAVTQPLPTQPQYTRVDVPYLRDMMRERSGGRIEGTVSSHAERNLSGTRAGAAGALRPGGYRRQHPDHALRRRADPGRRRPRRAGAGDRHGAADRRGDDAGGEPRPGALRRAAGHHLSLPGAGGVLPRSPSPALADLRGRKVRTFGNSPGRPVRRRSARSRSPSASPRSTARWSGAWWIAPSPAPAAASPRAGRR